MRTLYTLVLVITINQWISASIVKGYSSMAQFQNVIQRTLRTEGGYVNDPEDSGGETAFGISNAQYPDIDMHTLTLEQAKEIYKRDYWDRLRLDEIKSDRIAWKVFDIAVNCGTPRAAIMLQHSVGVEQDGVIGSETIATVNQNITLKNTQVVIDTLSELQARHYARTVRNSPKNAKFIVGWMDRAFDKGVGL